MQLFFRGCGDRGHWRSQIEFTTASGHLKPVDTGAWGENCATSSPTSPVVGAICRSVRSSLQLYFGATPALQPQTVAWYFCLLPGLFPKDSKAASTAQGFILPHLTGSQSAWKRVYSSGLDACNLRVPGEGVFCIIGVVAAAVGI